MSHLLLPLQALLNMVTDSVAQKRIGDPVKTALFSLGNACVHASCREHLRSLRIVSILQKMKKEVDSTLVKYIERVLSKLQQP